MRKSRDRRSTQLMHTKFEVDTLRNKSENSQIKNMEKRDIDITQRSVRVIVIVHCTFEGH